MGMSDYLICMLKSEGDSYVHLDVDWCTLRSPWQEMEKGSSYGCIATYSLL